MIFTKKIIKYGKIKWKKRFAFLPVKIKEDKGISKSGRIQLLVERLGDKK